MSDLVERMCIELRAIGRAHIADQFDQLRAELEAERARVAELHEHLKEYHDNAHYDEVGELYIGCCITEAQYQDTAELLSRTPAQSLAEVRAGALESWAAKAEIEYYTATGSVTEWPEVIGDIRREAARILAEAKEKEDG